MEIKLNLEQVSYLKGLDSKKKQRKFLLDCLVEGIIGESVKIKDDKCEVCLMYPKIKDSNKCEGCDSCIKNYLENDPYFISSMSRKVTDSPSKETEEINRLNPLYTTTTAPRTFENIKNRQEYGTGNFDFGKAYVEAIDRIIPKGELLKFDKIIEDSQEKSQQELFDYLNDEFNVPALKYQMDAIEKIVLQMNKLDESAKSEKKWNEKQLFDAYNKSIASHLERKKFVKFIELLKSN